MQIKEQSQHHRYQNRTGRQITQHHVEPAQQIIGVIVKGVDAQPFRQLGTLCIDILMHRTTDGNNVLIGQRENSHRKSRCPIKAQQAG